MEFQVSSHFPSSFEGIASVFVLSPVLLLILVSYLTPDLEELGAVNSVLKDPVV